MKIAKVLLRLFVCVALMAAPAFATVPSSTTYVQYVLSGNPQALPVPFVFQNASDLLVLDSKSSPPVTLVLNSDYSVSGGSGAAGTVTTIAGGSNGVQVGDTITISRAVPITQTTSFTNTGPLTAAMIGQALDKQTTISQEINLNGLRSLQFQGDESASGVLVQQLRKGNLLGLDSAGAVRYYTPNIPVVPADLVVEVSNIANMKALAVGSLNGRQASVLGYYLPGDGGGGVFYFSAASVLADNGGTVIAPNSGSGRWLRNLPNTQVNVRQFGAKGDGVTNDTAAIAAAMTLASATPDAYFYVPAGTYITDTISFTGATGLTIFGDGMGVSILRGRTPTRVLVAAASSFVNIHHLTFDGSCTTRTAGQQAVTFDCSNSSFCDNEITKSGEFAIQAGTGATTIRDVIVSRNYIHDTYADGITFANIQRFVIANNLIRSVDDDCIAIAYGGAFNPSQGLVIGNHCQARNDLGTTTGRGIYVARADNLLITGNRVINSKQTGIYVTNDSGTRCNQIHVIGNEIRGCASSSGYPIAFYGTSNSELIDNVVVETPGVVNTLMDIADWQNLTISGGSLTKNNSGACRGIHAEESAGWAASWDGIKIMNVAISLLDTTHLEGIYLNPNAAVTMNRVVIEGCVVDQLSNPATNYILLGTARVGTLGKIVNNTKMQAGSTVFPAASTGVVTVTNNN